MSPPDGERDAEVVNPPASADAPRGPLGSGTFTIEGRAAPGLFVAGWLATLIGGVVLFVSLQTGEGPAKLALFVVALLLVSVGLIAAAGAQAIERQANGIGPYAGPSPVLVFLACIPTAGVLLVLLGVPLGLLGVQPSDPVLAVISLTLQAAVYVLLIRLLVVDMGALSWREMGIRPPSAAALREFVIGVAWAPPVIFLTAPLAATLVALFGVAPDSPLPPAGESSGIVLNLMAGVILAPIGEELFFRGFATTAWVKSFGVRRGVILGALVFAFVHVLSIQAVTFDQGIRLALIGFLVRVPIALALGWLFVRRGSLWAPLGLHAAFNLILLVIAETVSEVPPTAQ